ncbi:MAG: HD domain-containing protein [Acidobacteriota bacterium]
MLIEEPALGKRFEEAFCYAATLHAVQKRKGSDIPYIAHLMAVCALVLEQGGDEDQAIAALLHDAVEDQGGKPTLEEIRRRFGARVARLVEGCTDADTQPKPPWRRRKEEYILHLQSAPPEVRMIVLADKIHNARSVLRDYLALGDKLWTRFKGGKEGTLWYYQTLAATFQKIHSGWAVDELSRIVKKLENAAKS